MSTDKPAEPSALECDGLPEHGEWSVADIRAHLPDKPQFWADRALVKLLAAYDRVVKERDEYKRYKIAALAEFETLKSQLAKAAGELARLQVQYDERGAAMRETGDMVRSLYAGSEVSKRILAQRGQIERLERELTKAREALKRQESAFIKAEVERRRLDGDLTAARAEIDRLKEEAKIIADRLYDPNSSPVEKDRDRWREMAGKLAEALKDIPPKILRDEREFRRTDVMALVKHVTEALAAYAALKGETDEE